MKSRMIIVGVAAALALAGSSFALGAGTHGRAAVPRAANQAQPAPRSLVRLGKAVNPRLRCGNLACVNGALTAIGRAFRHLNGCIGYMDVAQYDGYAFSNDAGGSYFQTTALDAAEPGDPATRVAILNC
jgi:hypothetical protein